MYARYYCTGFVIFRKTHFTKKWNEVIIILFYVDFLHNHYKLQYT